MPFGLLAILLQGLIKVQIRVTDESTDRARMNSNMKIRVITKLPNSEQSYKGKVKTHKYINRQNKCDNRTI
jgi:hypothetical protein